MTLKELRIQAGMTQEKMSEMFEIPKRTIGNWETGANKCPAYLEKLLREKMGEIIKNKARKALEKAKELDEWDQSLPEVEVGEIVEFGDIWDGEGEVPEESCYYKVTDKGEDGDGNVEVGINYEYVPLEPWPDSYDEIEDWDEIFKKKVKITGIELI